MTTKARREQTQDRLQLQARGLLYVETAHRHLASSRRAFGAPNRLDVEVAARAACEAAVDKLQRGH